MFPPPFFFINKRLVNHTIGTRAGVDFETCKLHCYHENNCVSVNYREKKKRCELNNATHLLHDNEFVDKNGYLYHGADVRLSSILLLLDLLPLFILLLLPPPLPFLPFLLLLLYPSLSFSSSSFFPPSPPPFLLFLFLLRFLSSSSSSSSSSFFPPSPPCPPLSASSSSSSSSLSSHFLFLLFLLPSSFPLSFSTSFAAGVPLLILKTV